METSLIDIVFVIVIFIGLSSFLLPNSKGNQEADIGEDDAS